MPTKLTLIQKLAALHEHTANNKASWHSIFLSLDNAATVLKVHRSTQGFGRKAGIADGSCRLEIELMLRAFALESLLKAIWIGEGNTVVARGDFKMTGMMMKHDLIKIAQAAGLTLATNERRLLRRLSRAVFLGRYPIGKEPVPVSDRRDGWSDEYDLQYQEFVDRLTRVIRGANPFG